MEKEQYAVLISVLQEISFGIKELVKSHDECPGNYKSDKIQCIMCHYASVCLRDSNNENIQD